MQKLAVVFLFALIVSCAGQESDPVSKSLKKTDTVQSFKKEIPTPDGKVDFWYGVKKNKEELLKLDSLESGFDSLQIRIWYEYSLVLYRDLVIIKCTNDVWTARHYHMKLKWDPNDNPVTFTSVKIEDVAPKSGWPQFINKLLELGIMTLPNMDDISNLQHGYEDGVTYNVEVATKKQYRFYGYYLPQEFANKFWQAKNMTEILSLISSELNIKAAF